MMECLALKQQGDDLQNEINIICFYIRNEEKRFRSDIEWNNWLHSVGRIEQYMAQDIQRWRNQNFACSVYHLKDSINQFLVEAINVDRPEERAYLTLPTLKGMRGQVLLYYIDQMLKI